MKIKKFAFGNAVECFVEENFSDNVNIIISNDNNKGKTLVFQGLMYSIGNEPIFPAGFNFRNYYFYSKIEIGDNDYEFLRKEKSFAVKDSSGMRVFESVSEFKYFLKNLIPEIPEMEKDGLSKLVDPVIFFELFFVGQDLRNPSGTFSGYYNKSDFINMLYALSNIGKECLSAEDIKGLKVDLQSKTSKRDALRKDLDRLNIDPLISRSVLQSLHNEDVKVRESNLKEINDRISVLNRALSREINRKYKSENLLSELNSLNRHMEIGSVKCGDCGSEKIIYSSGELELDLTNSYVKNSILSSIKGDIKLKNELIDEIKRDIVNEKRVLENAIMDTPVEVRDIFLFQDHISNGNKIDEEIVSLDMDIDDLKRKLSAKSENDKETQQAQKSVVNSIVSLMNEYAFEIDKSRREKYQGIFSTKSQTYSGSDQQIYYFCKLMALRKHFDYTYPIIIDAFREGEISSGKENLMIDKFAAINNQVLISATLKDEEYKSGKYVSSSKVNVIDYSKHIDNKILSDLNIVKFKNILGGYGIVINT